MSKDITVELAKEASSNKIIAPSKAVTMDKTNSIENQISINLCVSFIMLTVIFIVNEIIAG